MSGYPEVPIIQIWDNFHNSYTLECTILIVTVYFLLSVKMLQ